MAGSARLSALFAVVVFCLSARTAAQTGPPSVNDGAAAADADNKLSRAKELFRTGNTFLKNQDYHRALELFLKSREVLPSWQNTINAAICLDRLQRYDEALALYESALIEFSKDLTPDLRAELSPKLESLREKIGSLEVSADVNGAVIVDGHQRGMLPLVAPLRVLPGERTVRIIKDGYETFEQRIKIIAKQTQRIDAKLKVLASAGRLRVEAAASTGAEVRVDGAVVGNIPWEGTLAPGKHLYEVQKGDTGTGPLAITILQGQTALVQPKLEPLSKPVRLLVAPPSAALFLDEMRVENGWQGPLTVGKHVLAAREEGYVPETRDLAVEPSTNGNVELALRADPNHPRWAKAAPAKIWVEAFGGYALSASLGSAAERCLTTTCTSRGQASGFLVGVRGAYEFPVPISLEVSAGYLSMSNTVQRFATEAFETTTIRYDFADAIKLRGGLVSLGVGYRQPLGSLFGVQGRVHVAALFASARDDISASMSSPDRGDAAAHVENAGKAVAAVSVLIQPELQAHVSLGALRLGAGVTGIFLPIQGPANEHGETFADNPCTTQQPPLPINCSRASNVVAKERAFGPLYAVAPTISAGFRF